LIYLDDFRWRCHWLL